jgi:hypothetical protein
MKWAYFVGSSFSLQDIDKNVTYYFTLFIPNAYIPRVGKNKISLAEVYVGAVDFKVSS